MKKLNKLISFALILATIFSVPLFVPQKTFADISAPYTFEYDVVVSNPNGAQLLERKWDKEKSYYEVIDTVPENTKLTVYYEFESDGQKMIDVEYNERDYLVKASDVKYADDVFDMSKISKSSLFSQYIVNEENYLYKGPNERYGKNDDNYHLPAGIVVSSEYYDGLWLYVEYDGHSGWIKHMHAWIGDRNTANIATSEWDRSFITTRDKIELKDSPSEDGKTVSIMEVAPLTEIPVLYYIPTSKFTTEVYISYGQYSGWYTKNSISYDIAYRYDDGMDYHYRENGIAVRDAKVTRMADSDEGAAEIPANTEFYILYRSQKGAYDTVESKAYIRCNKDGKNIEGWISSADYAATPFKDKKYTTTAVGNSNTQPIYDMMNGKETGEYVEVGRYTIVYSRTTSDNGTWYYIAKNLSDENVANPTLEMVGWIKATNDDEVKEIENAKQEELKKRIENDEPEEVYTYPVVQNFGKSINEQAVDTMFWFLGGFGLLSVTIIISLIAAKKHRKNREASKEAKKDQAEEESNLEKNEDEEGPKSAGDSDEDDLDTEGYALDNNQKSEDIDDEVEPNSDDEAEENSENREENEKKEELKQEETDEEIEENIDEFLAENSPNPKEKAGETEPKLSEKSAKKEKKEQ